jgi:hypothetical protein
MGVEQIQKVSPERRSRNNFRFQIWMINRIALNRFAVILDFGYRFSNSIWSYS